MSVLNSMENRFGRFAVPGLVAILATLQAAVWILLQLKPTFLVSLMLLPPLVWEGEIWRLVTWVFIPNSFTNPFWMLIAVYFMMIISGVMDRAWGAFRTNLYIFGGMLSMIIGAMVFGSLALGLMLYSSIFIAFCCLVPNYEIMLFFILPVKVKYLGMVNGAILLLQFIDSPAMRGPIFFSMLNFFIAFGPGLVKSVKQKAVVVERRSRFESANQRDTPHFHKCHQCGKTDMDDPHLDFRVTEDGEEYCTVCRPRQQSAPVS